MKKIFLAFCFSVPVLAYAQTEISTEFEISSLYELGTAVLPHGNGFAVFGYSGGSTATNGDLFMLQLDENGKELMRRSYGLPDKTESLGKAVAPVGNNGWLVAGSQTNGVTINIKNGYLLRIGSNGTALWSKVITVPGYIGLVIHDLLALPSGEFIAAGTVSGGMATLRLTENGDVVWAKVYNNVSGPRAICLSESGGYFFAVTSGATVAKIRLSDGSLSWVKPIELPKFSWPDGDISVSLDDILTIGNGEFAVIGTALNDIVFEFVQAPYASVWKENGEITWAYAYSDNKAQSSTAYSAVYLPNQKHLLLAGETTEGPGVMRINTKGEVIGAHNIPAPGLCINPVLHKAQGRYMATGGSFQNGMNTFFYCSAGNALPAASLRPSERTLANETLEAPRLFPNPTSEVLQLNFTSATQTEALFYVVNALGQRLWSQSQQIVSGSNHLFFNVEHLQPGRYWLMAAGVEISPMAWGKN